VTVLRPLAVGCSRETPSGSAVAVVIAATGDASTFQSAAAVQAAASTLTQYAATLRPSVAAAASLTVTLAPLVNSAAPRTTLLMVGGVPFLTAFSPAAA